MNYEPYPEVCDNVHSENLGRKLNQEFRDRCIHCKQLAEDHEYCDRCEQMICEGTGVPSHNSDLDGVPYCDEACMLAAMGF